MKNDIKVMAKSATKIANLRVPVFCHARSASMEAAGGMTHSPPDRARIRIADINRDDVSFARSAFMNIVGNTAQDMRTQTTKRIERINVPQSRIRAFMSALPPWSPSSSFVRSLACLSSVAPILRRRPAFCNLRLLREARYRMAMNIVVTVGPRHCVVMLQGVPAIPEQVGFTAYYEATCEIVLADGQKSLCECVFRRERDRRNVVGTLLKDCLTIVLVTGLTGEQLTYAAIGITRYGGEISEEEGKLRSDRKNWHIGGGTVAP